MSCWADAWFIPEWRIAHRLWSVRVAVLWAVISGAWVALPAFQGFLPPLEFAALCIAFSVAMVLARLTHQPGVT